MCVGFLKLIFYQIHGLNIEIHILQSDSNNISIYLIFSFSQLFAKVLDYRAVGPYILMKISFDDLLIEKGNLRLVGKEELYTNIDTSQLILSL